MRVFTAISLIMAPINITGNLVVCLIVFKGKTMKTFTNLLLVNLALADMSFGILQLIELAIFQVTEVFDANVFCKSTAYSTHVVCGVSIVTLTIIAYERYQAVARPFRTRLKTTTIKKAVAKLIIIWLTSLISMSPVLYFQWGKAGSDGDPVCGSQQMHHVYPNRIFYFWEAIVFLALPNLIIIYCYSRVIFALWFSKAVCVSSTASFKSRRKLAKVLLFITLIFIVCWVAVCIEHMFYIFGASVSKEFNIMTFFMIHFNSSVNPFVYSLHSSKFRKSCKGIFS
ncbi:predicted protein, partial [Nematostella vectensis]